MAIRKRGPSKEGEFEVYKGRGRQPWRWRWFARNGNLVARSNEGHPTERLARKSAASSKFGGLKSKIMTVKQ